MDKRLQAGDTLLIASHNQGKVDEFQDLFAPFGIKLKSAGELNLPEPEETENSFHANALLKARAAAKGSGLLSLADDSGLCVTGLDDRPGIYSARWAGADKNFDAAMARIAEELAQKGFEREADRGAYFISVLALVSPDGMETTVEGRVDGSIVWPKRGDLGFGYDPIFLPRGESLTFGEMPSLEKHGIRPPGRALSHRARAFLQFESRHLSAS